MSNSIPLPPKAPDGLGWKLLQDGSWELMAWEPAICYRIMVGDRYYCGYYERESAEEFLLGYQEQFPNEAVSIKEVMSERPCREREEW